MKHLRTNNTRPLTWALTLLVLSGLRSAAGVPSKAALTGDAPTLETLGTLPLSFEANRGQADKRFRFLCRGSGYTLFFGPSEAALSLARIGPDGSTHRDFIRMKLLGANPAPRIEGVDPLPGRANYFIGNDPNKWKASIPTYGRVRYSNVYPGVDLVHYGNQGRLEHDFVIAPGADPRRIQLSFEGVDEVGIDGIGDLVLGSGASAVRLHKPLVYQEVSGTRRIIGGWYVLKGKRRVAFEVARYDRAKPLVIDPLLSYSTYLGGSSDEYCLGLARDASGNLYVGGMTQSTNFPTTAGAFRTVAAGAWDVFVTKLNPTGTAVLFSTYLGGSSEEDTRGLAVDDSGVYVAGFTFSSDFPTTPGAYQRAFAGFKDNFVSKLTPGGDSLVYSTFIGGSAQEEGGRLAVDSSGNAYITGETASGDYPTTPGAFQPYHRGGQKDAFVTKLNTAGTALVYSTYLGGSSWDGGTAIGVDSFGYAYAAGCTESPDFPVTAGAFQTSLRGSCEGYVTKLNLAGTGVVYSTFLGGTGFDRILAIALDADGNAYLTGQTQSSDFPRTPGAFQPAYSGGWDAFVAKLNATGSVLVYSRYLGGSGDDVGYKITVDSAKNAYVTGYTYSVNFPTLNPVMPQYGGGWDAFVTKVDAAGALVYSTYLGGSGDDMGMEIVVDPAGGVYVGGETGSTNFPITPGALQTTLAGGFDAFLAKIGTVQADFFLHGSTGTANPPTLFLDGSAPTAGTTKYKDSVAVKFSGGNPWKEVGTWDAAPALSPGLLSSLNDLHAWLGLKNSDDQGTRFDLRAEVLKNGTPVGWGETYCIEGVTRNPDLAKEATVAFSAPSPVSFNGSTDVLSLRTLTRIGTDGSGNFCGGHSNAIGLRLYFDGVSRPSRFGAAF